MSNSVDTVLEAVQQGHLGTRVGSLLATSTCIKPLWPGVNHQGARPHAEVLLHETGSHDAQRSTSPS